MSGVTKKRRLRRDVADAIAEIRETVPAAELTCPVGSSLDGMARVLVSNLHGIKNGLRDLDACLNSLAGGELSDACQRQLHHAQESLAELTKLVRGARDAGTSLATLSFRRTRIDNLVHKAVTRYRKDADRAEITITERSIDKIQDYVDPALIQQCFENVIGNAVRHLEPMRRRSGRKRKLRLNVDLYQHDGVWELVCQDNGPGIPSGQLKRFLDGKAPQKTNSNVCMGLVIARLFCENHYGRFLLDSVEQKGTTARILVPITNLNGSRVSV